jgi:hypothetical protein
LKVLRGEPLPAYQQPQCRDYAPTGVFSAVVYLSRHLLFDNELPLRWRSFVGDLLHDPRTRQRGYVKPTVLDDTCYFVPCASEDEARFICELLNSDVSQRFLRSLIFFDSKRPISIDVLNRIDFKRLAEHVNRTAEARRFLVTAAGFEDRQPLLVFEKKEKYRAKKRSVRRVPRRG